jgi:hypothetical protein
MTGRRLGAFSAAAFVAHGAWRVVAFYRVGVFVGVLSACCGPVRANTAPVAPGRPTATTPKPASRSTESEPPPRPVPAEPSTLPEESRGALGLPEVVVENIGLHIGGGPNTPAVKEPFVAAVAQRFRDFRLCYTHSNDPEAGGVFGVDLRIDREGGHPEVSEPRTKMGGPEFRQCVLDVFRSVSFERLDKPTVISYSMRFTLLDYTTTPGAPSR